MNSCFPFQTFCANLTQPSLLFHITCYGCSRSWAKQTKTNIKNTTTVLQRLTQCCARVPGTNRHRAAGVFRSHCPGKKKLHFDDRGCHLKILYLKFFFFFDSMGANNPPMGLATDRRGNQEGGGDVRGAVLNTTEQGARGGGVGEDQTTHLPFCSTSISGIGKESKKRVQKGRERLS